MSAALAILLVSALVGGQAATAEESPRAPKSSGGVVASGGASPQGSPVPSNWLLAFNYYRTMAGLPDVSEDTVTEDPPGSGFTWSEGGVLHSKWMVKNQTIAHDEPNDSPFRTEAGDLAGQNGNVMISGNIDLAARKAIESWITAPFHAIGMLDPFLLTTGFGEYSEGGDTYKYGATVDVLRGRDATPAPETWPVMFPGDGTTVHLDRYPGGEQPDPLAPVNGACNSLDAPTGLPIYLLTDDEEEYQSATFMRGTTNLSFCAYDDDGYSGSEPGDGGMGPRNAIFLIPTNPLTSERQFHVSITTNQDTYSWSFETGDTKPPTSRVTKPGKNDVVDQDNLEKIIGTASNDAGPVHVAVGGTKGTSAFKCRFLKNDGTLTAMRPCEDQVWLKANGGANWARKLNGKLPPTFHPTKGQIYDLKYYYVFSRATDEVGNVEKEPEFTGKYFAFFVKP